MIALFKGLDMNSIFGYLKFYTVKKFHFGDFDQISSLNFSKVSVPNFPKILWCTLPLVPYIISKFWDGVLRFTPFILEK
jgi:hypothetical protein